MSLSLTAVSSCFQVSPFPLEMWLQVCSLAQLDPLVKMRRTHHANRFLDGLFWVMPLSCQPSLETCWLKTKCLAKVPFLLGADPIVASREAPPFNLGLLWSMTRSSRTLLMWGLDHRSHSLCDWSYSLSLPSIAVGSKLIPKEPPTSSYPPQICFLKNSIYDSWHPPSPKNGKWSSLQWDCGCQSELLLCLSITSEPSEVSGGNIARGSRCPSSY